MDADHVTEAPVSDLSGRKIRIESNAASGLSWLSVVDSDGTISLTRLFNLDQLRDFSAALAEAATVAQAEQTPVDLEAILARYLDS